MGWPKEVPVLTAKDIHKGTYSGPDGTHCLAGWCQEVFGRCAVQREAAFESLHEQCQRDFGMRSIFAVNDSISTPAQAARTWNRAMRRLGYTEIS